MIIPATPATVVAALRSAAAAFRNGTIEWGVDDFRAQAFGAPVPTCCALGGIAHAVDPADRDGDPRWIHPDLQLTSTAAMHELANYLVTELDAPDAGNYSLGDPLAHSSAWERDAVEVVGDWNDRQSSVDAVIAALEAAADRLAARTVEQAVSA